MFISHLAFCMGLCLPVSAAAVPSPSPTINWVNCSKNVPVPSTSSLNVVGVNLSALPSTLHCGKLTVPMDYAKSIGPGNNITLNLAMYRPINPQGAIFFCPGGTDAGAADAWRVALNQTGDFFPNFSGLEDYDLMMLDIRGTWASNKLNASLDVFPPLVEVPYPTSQSEFDAFKAASKAMIQSFADSSSPPGFVQFTGTNEVVQDYDAIRKALGYDKVNFLGLSYGSYRAAQYAATFPGRVGNFVLDAVVTHGLGLFEQANDQIAMVNRALLRADAFCQNSATCPFKDLGKGAIPKAYNEILAAVKNSSSSTFNVQNWVTNELGNQPNFPYIFEGLQAFIAGNSSFFGGGSPTIDSFVAFPYLCTDYPIEDNTFSGFQKSIQTGSKLDTNNLGITEAWQVRLFCSAWPYTTAPVRNLSIEAPMLLVTSDYDASAPTEFATYMRSQVPNAAFVVRHGDDHTTFNLPTTPATLIEKEFLLTGKLPAMRNDTFVTIYHPGSPRAPIPNPYDVPTGFLAGDCTVASECNLN